MARPAVGGLSRDFGGRNASIEHDFGSRTIANGIAYAALFGWPLVAAALFLLLPLEAAAAWSLLGGWFLLPSGFKVDLPLLPPIDKNSVTVLSTLVLCLAKGSPRPRHRPGIFLPIAAAAYVVAPIGATFGNSYELHMGNLSLPGFYLLDGIKGAIDNLVTVSALYVGLRFLSNPAGQRAILKALVGVVLIYSAPMLWELRFSPQLHRIVYGFAPSEFQTAVRAGGYRPMVFLAQGLQLALLVTMALIAACTLSRCRIKIFRLPSLMTNTYLLAELAACKTLGATIYAAVLAPLAAFARPSTSIKVASAIMLLVCAYPALRTQQLVPVDRVLGAAKNVSEDRANSFRARLENETILMAKANEKPLFGWGAWGRNRVYNAEFSKDVTITDGGWIITFGTSGWFGYLGLFGMFTIPVLRLNRTVKKLDREDALIAAGLALALAANVGDMIPNANLMPITFVIAGSIARRTARSRATRRSTPAPESDAVELTPARVAPHAA